jgi:rod shape-determining protein MreB and related proteins
VIFNFFGKFKKKLAIDLGTANTLIYESGKGIVFNEPSVVALNKDLNKIIAVGKKAHEMVGRTPSNIVATSPLVNGVVADYEVTEQMLKYFIDIIKRDGINMGQISVVLGVPYGITDVEKRAVYNAAINAGCRKAFLIEEPMAAAIGCMLPVHESIGNMIVEIGGGTTEIALVSLGEIVSSKSLKVAGNKFSSDILDFLRTKYNLIIGEKTAERVKMEIGCAYKMEDPIKITVPGRDLISGLPTEIEVNSDEVLESVQRSVDSIVAAVKEVIEFSPPELIIDVYKQGIVLSGGGSLLRSLDKLIESETGIKTFYSKDPLLNVVQGAGTVADSIEELENVLLKTDYKAPPF